MNSHSNDPLRPPNSTWKKIKPKIGQTPKSTIWKKNKATVWYYPSKNKKYKTPLFLIYSLVGRSYILDLGPGYSMIEAFTHNGFDVYLLDFGIPSNEDGDLSLDDYITKYIQRAVQHALRHAKAKEITIIGYCLGGTLATIYAAIAKEPIKNIVLLAPPLDFSSLSSLEKEKTKALLDQFNFNEVIDDLGVIPTPLMELGMRLISTPISITPYVSLLENLHDTEYVRKWNSFNQWTDEHVPLVGKTLKQLIEDLLIANKLTKNELTIAGQEINLSNITANLLVVSPIHDEIVPEEHVYPIIHLVSSKDKTYKRVNGGHVTLAIEGEIPSFFKEWLISRS